MLTLARLSPWRASLVVLLGIGLAISMGFSLPSMWAVIWAMATGVGMFLAGLLGMKLKPVLATPSCCVAGSLSLAVYQDLLEQTSWVNDLQWMVVALLAFLLSRRGLGRWLGGPGSGVHDA